MGRKVISFLRAPEMVEMRNPVPPLWWLENHLASALVMETVFESSIAVVVYLVVVGHGACCPGIVVVCRVALVGLVPHDGVVAHGLYRVAHGRDVACAAVGVKHHIEQVGHRAVVGKLDAVDIAECRTVELHMGGVVDRNLGLVVLKGHAVDMLGIVLKHDGALVIHIDALLGMAGHRGGRDDGCSKQPLDCIVLLHSLHRLMIFLVTTVARVFTCTI